jgi:TP901 family phage tail tape measure protein
VAFSARELLLVLRARDEASRVVRSFATEFARVDAAAQRAARNQIGAGSALVSVAAGMAGVGIAAGAWLKGSTDLAVEFNKEVAYTSTQLDKVAGSQKQLGDIIKRTAGDIAVPLDQLHAGLYDIFSSMNVTVPESEKLLRSFAKEAVAGQVELKEASRATIGILNAFHLKVGEVTRVQDVQFQLVRKGVGTYEEFARVMGRATPSAARAGQTVEVLSGMLAYLTRNGLSAAMAAASAGRAFDAFSHPKTVNKLKELGVNAKNASGEFRPFTEVIRDLQRALKDMTAPERAAALYELFKGSGGTIQARRFYDMVTKDKKSVDQFVGLVGDMQNAHGAFEEAYTTMADTTAAKSELIANQWQLLRIEVGEALIPVLSRLMDVISMGLKWWNGLDASLRKQITTWVGVGAVIAVALSIVIAMAGGFLMLSGAAAAVGIGILPMIAIFLGIAVAVGGLIVAIIYLRKNWNAIIARLGDAWERVWAVVKPIIDWFVDHIGFYLVDLWNRASADIIAAVKAVGEWVKRVWTNIANWARDIWPGIKQVIEPIIDWLISVWPFLEQSIVAVLRVIVDAFDAAWTVIVAVVRGAWFAISGIIEGVITVFRGIIDFIVGILTLDFDKAFRGIIQIVVGFAQIIIGVFRGLWEVVKGIFVAAWDLLGSIVGNGLIFLGNLLRVFFDGIGRLWNQFWNWVGGLVSTIWTNIKTGTKPFFDWLSDAFETAVTAIGVVWDKLKAIVKAPINFIITVVYNKGIAWLWNKVADFTGLGRLPLGQALADGGPVVGPGGPRDDKIPALLSNGEYVMPADKTSKYYPLLQAMRAGAALPGFADGGAVGNVIDWVGGVSNDVKNMVTSPVDYITSHMDPASLSFAKKAAQIPVHLIAKTFPKLWAALNTTEVVGWRDEMWSWFIKNTEDPNKSADAMIARLKSFAYAQRGKPYEWGAVGPNSYDCSGLVGNLWAAVMGKPAYRRYMTTATMGAGKFNMLPGPGYFTVYLNKEGGHTAANLKGLHVEAYGGNGTPITVGKVGTPLSYYNQILHVFADGGFVDMKHNKTKQMASFLKGGWPEPYLFDSGGIWKSGTLGFNNTGRDEMVLDPDRTDALLRSADRGGHNAPIVQHFYITTQEIDPKKHAADLGWEITNRGPV